MILYHVLIDGPVYEESRYDRHDARAEERDKKRAIAARERLGYEGALSPVHSTAQTRLISVGWQLVLLSVRGPKCRLIGIGAPMRRKNFVGN